MMDALASIIIVSYNHRKYIGKCIESIKRQDYPHEVIIVDNESSDGTPDFIESTYPDVKIIRNKNTGFGAGNNLGAKNAIGEYVVFLNPDTFVEERWLQNLVAPLRKNPRIIVAPKILLYDGSAINTCGNLNHFTGLTFIRGYLEPPQSRDRQEEISGISGACFAMRKDEFDRMGGFDERFFLYNEDSEFSWRAHLFEIPILFMPSAVVYHDYTLTVSPQKMYYLEKGRYIILKTYLSGKMSAILMPSLVMAEVLSLGYAARFGWTGITFKCRAFVEGVVQQKNSPKKIRSSILKHLEVKIPTDQLVSSWFERFAVRICNRVFSWNISVFRAFDKI